MRPEGTAVRFGVDFPQRELSTDPLAIRDFAQAVEAAGFDYLVATEHVLGAHPDRFIGVGTGFATPPFQHTDPFHDPFTLFSYLAGMTSRIELVSGVLVLPQRQTALVAKQAAAVDILSRGRLRLGVGVGWSHAEYQGLGQEFHTRGRRQEEQIAALRKLWTEELVTFEGEWHTLDRVAILPRPSRLIPIWLGSGTSDPLLQRAARIADGWMPNLRLFEAQEAIDRLSHHLEDAGRDPHSFGFQVMVRLDASGSAEWLQAIERWVALGVTHLTLATARGLSPNEVISRVFDIRRQLEHRR